MRDWILKGVTLVFFVGLLVAFILYRSGYFTESELDQFTSPNGSVLNSLKTPSQVRDSLKKRSLISSSKVIIMNDELPLRFANDTPSAKELDSMININPLILGSKSGVIFKMDDFKNLKNDSSEKDSTWKK